MVNSASGFSNPTNTAKYTRHYLYLGFLEATLASNAGMIQGWRADGKDISFTNCDGNPNSYFTFYPTLEYSGTPYVLGHNFASPSAWRSGVNALDVVDSVRLFYFHK